MKIAGNHLDYLKNYFDTVENMAPKTRGTEFEKFLTLIFRYSAMDAINTQKQTEFDDQIDMHVFGTRNLLVECKWESNKVSKQQVESFVTRLRRRDPVTVGLFVSVNGFSKPALNYMKLHAQADRALIILTKKEIKLVYSAKIDLELLINQKIRYIQRGVLYITEETTSLKTPHWPLDFPSSSEELKITDKPWVCVEDPRFRMAKPISFSRNPFYSRFESQFSKISFISEQNSTYSSFFRILDVLDIYNDLYGFSGNSSFAISQFEANWYGYGINNFLLSLHHQKERYDNLSEEHKHFHHHEGAFFVNYSHYDHIMVLAFDPNFDVKSREFDYRHIDLSFYSLNDPYEIGRLNLFAKKAGFDYIIKKTKINTHQINLPNENVKVEMVFSQDSQLIDNHTSISGGLIKNPLYAEKSDDWQRLYHKISPKYIELFKQIPAHFENHFELNNSNTIKTEFVHINFVEFDVKETGLSPVIIDISLD